MKMYLVRFPQSTQTRQTADGHPKGQLVHPVRRWGSL